MGHCRWKGPTQLYDTIPRRSHGPLPETRSIGHHGQLNAGQRHGDDKSSDGHIYHSPMGLPCFTFSQTTEELVCGMERQGIWLFNISTRRFRQVEYPDTVISVSSLQNGTVVANFAGSGIQLLSLDGGCTPSEQTTISALTVHVFDQDRIIAIFPTRSDYFVLLEPATMSQLLKIPVPNPSQTPTDCATILCASHDHLMAVYYFEEGSRGFLQLWRFHEELPSWTVEVDGAPEICLTSPTAAHFVTLRTTDSRSCVCLWNAKDG